MVLITGQFLERKYVFDDRLIAANPSHREVAWVTSVGLRIYHMEEEVNFCKGCRSRLLSVLPCFMSCFLGEQFKDQHSSLADFLMIQAGICLLSEISDAFSQSLSAGPFLNYTGVEVKIVPPNSSIFLPGELLETRDLLHHLLVPEV